ncbi:MAG: hypothetical protein KKD31_16360 [Bacteroidetes bacterium]|nr:hypothetical protein [Bacteroidota bacterium]
MDHLVPLFMLIVPIEIDPYSDENIKRIGKSEFAEEIFSKVFGFLDQHRDKPGYEGQIRRMRDLKNCIDYARETGRQEGLEIAKKMKERFSVDEIEKLTGYSKEEIESLR